MMIEGNGQIVQPFLPNVLLVKEPLLHMGYLETQYQTTLSPQSLLRSTSIVYGGDCKI